MDPTKGRQERLFNLLELARVSRGWNRTQLAAALDRDPTKLFIQSGNPKMDFLVRLSDVLEWPVGDVVNAIWGPRERQTADPSAAGGDIHKVNAEINTANRAGEYARMAGLARHMFEIAKTSEHRVSACLREAQAWDGLGRYQRAADAIRLGLRQEPISTRQRLMLQANLANFYYLLWDLQPALGISKILAEWYQANPPEKGRDEKRPAFVHYVRGHTHRRLMACEPENRDSHARAAAADLTLSMECYDRLAAELNEPSLAGIANTCRGGLIEARVELGELDAREAIGRLHAGVFDRDPSPLTATGDWAQSEGWWCIFASDIALRHLEGRELQKAITEFTGRAMEIADRLDHWALRERIFTMQYTLHRKVVDAVGFEVKFSLDRARQHLVTATMGRFPTFKDVGWSIIQSAGLVETE